MKAKKIYFASDQHFGAPNAEKSLQREKVFVKWLDTIKKDAEAIFLLGDLFDFWFEYKHVVPKGFVRVLGKIAEIRDAGIPIYFFVGNHDLWMIDYFEKELNIPVYREPTEFTLHNKTFLIGHGDGLGPGDKGYKFLKKIFVNPLSNWLFKWLHPDLGMGLAKYLSVENKTISGAEDVHFLGEYKEHLILYCKEVLKEKHYDYFVFGHRHLPMIFDLPHNSQYINTGDWISYFTYGVLENGVFDIKEYK
ncbi:UDP-2,3-diacylglucosamine hydrolase [Wenyingzhuangia heitensis]|uniref:UDP-2,3-diacylglucosamine hydrolase n=1 Tax=Wenyingzhuangia heitensis TaxID=1487859 RepID=A0ABX0U658_9FLAO|nr:UDP-2,3-diacylglucosamine diphosphatase [Wenyingzhuangia heitensis]NIJ43839.1 UDP-2,3-diacylglucosamine hydrolase [Wenyingzhuangia heitensis]